MSRFYRVRQACSFKQLALLFLLVPLLGGCNRGRTVVGGYRLEQFHENNNFYLHKDGVDDSKIGGSIIEGVVLNIGWNERFIVAERHSFYRGDPDGWMIIDVRSGTIAGPFKESELRARAEVRGMEIFPVSEAWEKL
jgi:hypothetical protein